MNVQPRATKKTHETMARRENLSDRVSSQTSDTSFLEHESPLILRSRVIAVTHTISSADTLRQKPRCTVTMDPQLLAKLDLAPTLHVVVF